MVGKTREGKVESREASGRCGFEPLSGISAIFLRTIGC